MWQRRGLAQLFWHRRTLQESGFSFANSLFNLSRLSVWWLRLGIAIERIKPGHPQQNGRHERMHLTLKLETTKPAGKNFLQQQAKFDDFVECFNNERPHQALNMRCPAECYVPSSRPYAGLPELDYPFHDKTVTVTTCGRICFNRQKINLSTVFAGQKVGIKQVSEEIWLVRFMHHDLGYFDRDLQARTPGQPLRTQIVAGPHPRAQLSPSRSRERARLDSAVASEQLCYPSTT